MKIFDRIEAWGHPNISAKNKTTFEVTKENLLTSRGDCIIAINSNKGARDLNDELKHLARSKSARITMIIEAGDYNEVAVGRGDPQLTFNHPTDLIVRKSSFMCNRTLMIESNKAAFNFSRDLIKASQRSSQKIVITLTVEIN